MDHLRRTDPRYRFFEPFLKSRQGHIVGVATQKDNMRDGLAVSHIARFFPLPGFEQIVVEPSRAAIHPGRNVIFIGRSALFYDADAQPLSDVPTVIGKEKLEERIKKLEGCYEFVGKEHRSIVNTLTGKPQQPSRKPERDSEVDFGVIRRLFRGPGGNTIILEGVHRLGTLAAALVATDATDLDAVWTAVEKLEAFEDSRPLEILVRGTFHPRQNQGVYSIENITAVPLEIVYDGQMVYEMLHAGRWVDERPWSAYVVMQHNDPPRRVPNGREACPKPRLEIQADLATSPAWVKSFLERLFPTPSSGRKRLSEPEKFRLLAWMAEQAEHFHLIVVNDGTAELPRSHRPARERTKRFIVLLALCRAFGTRFRREPESIAAFFPDFAPQSPRERLPSRFTAMVRGKMWDGFKDLLGTPKRAKGLVHVNLDQAGNAYELQLQRSALVLKLRY